MKPRKAALLGVTLVTPALTAGPAAAKTVHPSFDVAVVASDAMQAQHASLKAALLALDPAAKLEIAGDRVSGLQLAQIAPAPGAAHTAAPIATVLCSAQNGPNNTGRCVQNGPNNTGRCAQNGPNNTGRCATQPGAGTQPGTQGSADNGGGGKPPATVNGSVVGGVQGTPIHSLDCGVNNTGRCSADPGGGKPTATVNGAGVRADPLQTSPAACDTSHAH